MAMLAEIGRPVIADESMPSCPKVRAPGVGDQRACRDIGDALAMVIGQPLPAADQRDHVAGKAMNRSKPASLVAVEILGPYGAARRLLQVSQQTLGLHGKQRKPARLAGHV